MKKTFEVNLSKSSLLALITFLLLGVSISLTSCNEEDEDFNAPTLSLVTSSSQDVVGTDVSTDLNITAPGKAEELVILKNGVPFKTETLDGSTSLTYQFVYTIEEAPVGTLVNFSFQVTDRQDKQSAIVVYEVRVSSKSFVEIPEGNIAGDQTWIADNIYRLNGFVRVPDGVTLTIEPGTIVVGDRETKGTLVVQMGGMIIAEGTSENPIIMTSERPVGFREPGDWGGLVICGKAPNNTGGVAEIEGGYGAFHGGNTPDDNSGILKYVRIEYAGIPINPNEEVNSLTMGSIGSGTKIDYVMCTYGLDDSFEWFGGTSEHKYLIAYRGLDDDFDVDLGYSGKVQFALGVRSPMGADQSGSNGFEVDNNGAGSSATPYSSAVFANISIIGPKANRELPVSLQFQHAAQLRRNSRISIYNSYMTGYPSGLYIDDDRAGSGQAFLDDELQIRNLFLAGVEHWGGSGYGSAGTVFEGAPANGEQHPNNPRGVALKSHANFPGGQEAYEAKFFTEAHNNRLYDKWQDLGIDASAFLLGEPKFTPNSNSILLNAAKWDNTPKADNFFEQVPFVGAFGSEDWSAGWTEFNVHVLTYF